MSLQALVHVDPSSDAVHGVWLDDDGVRDYFYASGAGEHRRFAEGLMTETTWGEQIRMLAGTDQYMAWWYEVPRSREETAQQVFERLSHGPSQLIHHTYLPFSRGQLWRHFAAVGGGGLPARHLRYYLASAHRNLGHSGQVAHPRPADAPLCSAHDHQVEKDERFWVVSALMSIFYGDDRIGGFAKLIAAALGTSPSNTTDLDSWADALGDHDDLELYFEVNLPSPPAYKKWLGDHQIGHNLVPFLVHKADGRGLEGPTHVDAMLIAPSTGFAVAIEAKVLSDASSHTTYDAHRNQIARNVDVLLETNTKVKFPLTARRPDRTCLVLLTPEVFRDEPTGRLYGTLMESYTHCTTLLRRHLPHRTEAELAGVPERIGWTTFEACRRIEPAACAWLGHLRPHVAGLRIDAVARKRASCSACADGPAQTVSGPGGGTAST